MTKNEQNQSAHMLKQKRLAEQLRKNLKRRKGQANASRAGKADQTSGLPLSEGLSDQNPDKSN